MEKFLTGDIWEEANNLFEKGQSKFACIAYITSEKLKLSKGDTLICDASTFAIKFGETSAKTLKFYISKGVKLFSNSVLHSKLLLTDKFLLIGSANLSKNSAKSLIESSIVTDNDVLLSGAKAFCYNLTKESIPLTKKNIEALLKIEVVKRAYKPIAKSKTRLKKIGNKYWFISASLLSEKTYDKIKENVESTTAAIAERENIDSANVSFLRWRANTEFSVTAKEGDQIILKYNNDGKTRSFVFPPSTILERQVKDGFVYFYHDDRNFGRKKVSWTKFQEYNKNLGLTKPISTRTKLISEDDIKKIKPVWIDK